MTITQPLPKAAPPRRSPNITAPKTRRKLSFIVPAPGCDATPQELYEVVQSETDSLNADWELLFIDHGECEKTWLLIQSLVRRDPSHVRACIFSKSQNRSSALALGYREATGDLVFSIEADQQDDPREISGFLERIEWDLGGDTPRDSMEPWQNILPRGVLRGTPGSMNHASGLAA